MKKLCILLFSLFLLHNNLKSADYCRIVPWIKKWEAGLAHLPEGTTNRGVIYEKTWIYYFGNTYDRFLIMSDDDWGYIFKNGYWDRIKGDSIQNQEVAELLADWVWMSGTKTPTKKVQKVLGLPQTGTFDSKTLSKINKSNGRWLWEELVKERFKFITNLVADKPDNYRQFLNGWINRQTDMVFYQFEGSCESN